MAFNSIKLGVSRAASAEKGVGERTEHFGPGLEFEERSKSQQSQLKLHSQEMRRPREESSFHRRKWPTGSYAVAKK